MGLELPPALTEPLSWVGLEWPEADEEKLFLAGQAWIEYGARLRHIATETDQISTQVWQTNEGDAADAFRGWWLNREGPKEHFSDDALAADLIGAALIAFAVITLTMKIAFIVQLTMLALAVAQAIAAAFATAGASTAAIPSFVALARAACRQLLRQVVDLVQNTIERLLARAKALLRKADRGRGRGSGHGSGGGPTSVPGPLTTPRYGSKPMLDRYRYEFDGSHPTNPFRPRAVRRLSDDEREAYRVFIDEQGLMRSARDGTPFDTRNASTAHSGGGRGIFVMDEKGNIYSSTHQEVGVFHHSTLANGQPVAAAGELSVVNGQIQHATAASGHYQPGPTQMQNLADELTRNNVNDVPVYDFTGTQRWF